MGESEGYHDAADFVQTAVQPVLLGGNQALRGAADPIVFCGYRKAAVPAHASPSPIHRHRSRFRVLPKRRGVVIGAAQRLRAVQIQIDVGFIDAVVTGKGRLGIPVAEDPAVFPQPPFKQYPSVPFKQRACVACAGHAEGRALLQPHDIVDGGEKLRAILAQQPLPSVPGDHCAAIREAGEALIVKQENDDISRRVDIAPPAVLFRGTGGFAGFEAEEVVVDGLDDHLSRPVDQAVFLVHAQHGHVHARLKALEGPLLQRPGVVLWPPVQVFGQHIAPFVQQNPRRGGIAGGALKALLRGRGLHAGQKPVAHPHGVDIIRQEGRYFPGNLCRRSGGQSGISGRKHDQCGAAQQQNPRLHHGTFLPSAIPTSACMR